MKAIKTAPNLVLRTVYISPELDDQLRVQAFVERTSKNDLIRRYIVEGMKSMARERELAAAATVASPMAAPI